MAINALVVVIVSETVISPEAMIVMSPLLTIRPVLRVPLMS